MKGTGRWGKVMGVITRSKQEAQGAGLAGKRRPRAYLMLELVESLLQTDLLHLQQGAILDFIQREAVLFSEIGDQRVLREGSPQRSLASHSMTTVSQPPPPTSEASLPVLSNRTHRSKAERPSPPPHRPAVGAGELQWASSSDSLCILRVSCAHSHPCSMTIQFPTTSRF